MSTSTPGSAVRRLQQVYVEIPPSPLHSNRPASVSNILSRHPSSSSNTLRNASLLSSSAKSSGTSSNKRKYVDISSGLENSPKRSKTDSTLSTMPMEVPTASNQPMLYCHQCNKKRGLSDIVQCTFRVSQTNGSSREHRCNAKYCRSCLRNRYHEDLDRIKMTTKGQKENGHAHEANYIFKCHKCRGQCNCWRCRKQAGLSPLGVNKPTASSLDKTQAGNNPSNTQPNLKPGLKPRKHAVDSRPKPLPAVKWTPLSVQISINEVEDRVFIREFMLRFSSAMGRSVAKTHLEELEHVCEASDSSSDARMPSWVSEACVKSIILGLLGLLAKEEESSASTVLKGAIKDIHSCGVNMTKIWNVLSSLRSSLGPPDDHHSETSDGSQSSEDRIIIDFPDPLSAPPNTFNYNTRTMRSFNNDCLFVANTAQMIPVVVSLIHTAIESQTIRDAIDEGMRDNKEKFRESRESIKLENDRWEQRKQELDRTQQSEGAKIKLERHAHKLKVQAIENAFKVVSWSFAPRFSPLGTDHDGRTYWTLTPGVYDREYALECISPTATKSRKLKKPHNRKYRHKKDEEDRKSFKEWSWFLAVSGKGPDLEESGRAPQKPGNTIEDDLGWWVFWNPDDIHKLAEWLSVKNGLGIKTTDEERPSSSSARVTTLVKGLRDYATILEWRAKGEDG